MYTLFMLHVMANALLVYFVTYIDSIYICNDRWKANKWMNEWKWPLWHGESDHRFVYKRQTMTSLELQLHWLYLYHIVWQVGRKYVCKLSFGEIGTMVTVVLHKCIRNQDPTYGHNQRCKNDEWMIAWDSISLVNTTITKRLRSDDPFVCLLQHYIECVYSHIPIILFMDLDASHITPKTFPMTSILWPVPLIFLIFCIHGPLKEGWREDWLVWS